MASPDIAISVRNLTKTYRLFGHPGDRIKQFLSLGFRKYHQEFTALRDVSFDIKKGETVGIIGRNGSGKSTLPQPPTIRHCNVELWLFVQIGIHITNPARKPVRVGSRATHIDTENILPQWHVSDYITNTKKLPG